MDSLIPLRFDCEETLMLRAAVRNLTDLQWTWHAIEQRGGVKVPELKLLVERAARLVTRQMRELPLAPWFKEHSGLGGTHMAILLSAIGTPWRFPGQRCTLGHYAPPLYAEGDPCPYQVRAECPSEIELPGGPKDAGVAETGFVSDLRHGCPGIMLAPRSSTGTRSLWHFCGVHVAENGLAPRRRKGQKFDWNPDAKQAILQPGGIAEQIVRLSVPTYVDIYREQKERLLRERAASTGEIDLAGGPLAEETFGAASESDPNDGRLLRPFQIDNIARLIAAKAAIGDMLAEWKRVAPLQ